MAADAANFSVDTAGLNSGAASSRQASDHAGDGAANLAGASVGGDMFGGFPAASSFAEAVGAAGLTLDQVDLFVYHQANARILRAVGERLDLQPEKVADYIAEVGNTSAASIPLALDQGVRDGRIKPGQLLLLEAMGGGLTWGACVLRL